ncbi:MAG: hypothetical protein KDI48_13150, partial [Xanthomonadales bacterium]|nr:hypothetical protein [Xanthomonadales bacterium]
MNLTCPRCGESYLDADYCPVHGVALVAQTDPAAQVQAKEPATEAADSGLADKIERFKRKLGIRLSGEAQVQAATD